MAWHKQGIFKCIFKAFLSEGEGGEGGGEGKVRRKGVGSGEGEFCLVSSPDLAQAGDCVLGGMGAPQPHGSHSTHNPQPGQDHGVPKELKQQRVAKI